MNKEELGCITTPTSIKTVKVPYFFEQMPPLNSSCTIWSSERKKCRLPLAASMRSTHTRVRIISDNGHHANARAICVELVPGYGIILTQRQLDEAERAMGLLDMKHIYRSHM